MSELTNHISALLESHNKIKPYHIGTCLAHDRNTYPEIAVTENRMSSIIDKPADVGLFCDPALDQSIS
jgi:hypothetical protein